MTVPLEDYALIGDMETAALVSRSGSIDWLCLPRFDSDACFASLLGTSDNGRWQIAPAGQRDGRCTSRRYWPDTMILESVWETTTGSVRVLDFMPPRDDQPDLMRIVQGISGRVAMRSELELRFAYGAVIPWVRSNGGHVSAVAGPDAVSLRSDTECYGKDFATYSDFTLGAGDHARFVLSWYPSHLNPPAPRAADQWLRRTQEWWEHWSAKSTYRGEWSDAVGRSLLTLKALTYYPTGGIVAAPTTSLPEDLGGERNWDYRYCWLRDATMTLAALMRNGYLDEADHWRSWLLRAIAGVPEDTQIMYGIAGERRLAEQDLGWLTGYAGSRPVRIGNGASRQFQLDVYGEVMDALALAREGGLPYSEEAWDLQTNLVGFVCEAWNRPDEGIWEVRGPRRHFTFSKVMAWVALNRAIEAVRHFGRSGEVDRWRKVRDEIRAEVLTRAYDPDRNTFTMAYDMRGLDAALLMMPQVGFLPATDPRMVGTIRAIQSELAEDGLVRRYDLSSGEQSSTLDGLAGTEGAFLACSFWLADALHSIGEVQQARESYERLLDLRNDVGLLAEEYDTRYGRMVGNFPQAYSHIALINTAAHLGGAGPSRYHAGPPD